MLIFKINSEKIKKICSLLGLIISFIIIIWSMYLSINGIMFVIKATLTNNLFEYDALISTLNKIFKVHESLLMVPIFLLIYMLFKRSLNIYVVVLSILFGFYLHSYEFFDNVIHPFLFKLHIYDFLLRPGQTILNSQYSKLLFYFILIGILFIMVCMKKYRTIDRVFILLISGAVLITTFIFHIAMPMGMFKYVNIQLQENLAKEITYTSEDYVCKDKNCFWLNKELKLIKSNEEKNNALLDKYQYYIKGAKKYYDNESSHQIFSGALGAFKGQEFDYIIAGVKPTTDGYLVVMDENIGKKYSRQSEIWFSFLTSCAHFLWIYGGIGLLFLHKIIFFRRRKITNG